MNFTDVDEPVKVAVVFEGGKMSPKWFIRQGRKFIVKQTDFIWNEKQGNREIVNFSVTTEGFAAELAFDKKYLTWHLKKTITD